MATKIAMRTIPKPPEGTRSVLILDGPGTIVVKGDGPLTFVCGECSATLARRVDGGQLANLVLRCNTCGRFNETIT